MSVATVVRVSRELGLADELHLTSVSLRLLPDRRQALDNRNKRTDIPGIRGVVNKL